MQASAMPCIGTPDLRLRALVPSWCYTITTQRRCLKIVNGDATILVEQVRMPSVTLKESVENANWLAGKILEKIPEVETVVPKTGRSDLANDWMGVHQTDVWVLLKPRSKWRSGVNKEDIIDQIKPFLTTEPGLSYNFTQPIAMRVDELTSGVKSDVAVKVFGEELEVLNRTGADIMAVIQTIKGTDNAYIEQTIGQPYLTIEIDRDAVASYGLNVNDVQRVVEVGIGGQTVSEVFEGQRRWKRDHLFCQCYRRENERRSCQGGAIRQCFIWYSIRKCLCQCRSYRSSYYPSDEKNGI